VRIDRQTLIALVVALSLGWWFGHSPASPVGPPAFPDRPVLKAFGRVVRLAARAGLWFALAGESAGDRPRSAERPPAMRGDERNLVRSKAPVIGADGLEEIDHGEGW
jgi:hypothetical protein